MTRLRRRHQTPVSSGINIVATSTVPTGAGWTDGTDAAANLQAFFTALANGPDANNRRRIVFPAGFTWIISTGINLAGKANWIIDGSGTPVPYGHTGGAIVKCYGDPNDTHSAVFYSGKFGGAAAANILYQNISLNGYNTMGGTVNAHNGVPIASVSVASPTVITTTVPHGFATGETRWIAGVTSTPSVNGGRVVTVTGANTFTVAVNVTVGAGAGGAINGGEYQMGINWTGGAGLEVSHCIFDRDQGDGIYISDRSLVNPSSVYIHDSTVQLNGRMGIATVGCDGLIIDACKFTDICYSVFDIEPDTAGQVVNNVIFKNNLITGNWSWDPSFDDAMFAQTGATTTALTGYLQVLNNLVTGSTRPYGSAVSFFRCQFGPSSKSAYLTISGNVCTGTKDHPGAYVANFVNGMTITNNTGFLDLGGFVTNLGGNGTIIQSGNS